jgi:light-regulated signal transduction histidine kinase (bacteriophytochrome)
VVIAQGLRARGDERLLRVIMVNLLSNAWKFTSNHDSPRIEVGSLAGEEPTFFVRDNGAGFDMEYAHRLFSPFQRLHDQGEFEGTGVGLATVGRIVARHHGKVWAKSALSQGATFYFTLPDDSDAPKHGLDDLVPSTRFDHQWRGKA